MKKREANFGILFRHWVMANPGKLPRACTFEVKQTTTDALPFDALEPHQVDYSTAVSWGVKGILMRIPGVNGEPDYCYYRGMPAFVVIKYPSVFVVITIDAFLKEKATSPRKSLTSARAREIAIHTVEC